MAKLAARIGLGPTAVTMISVLFAVAAAGLFAVSGAPTTAAALVAGGVLLYLGFVLDCVDGQLARYTRNFSAVGRLAGHDGRPGEGVPGLRRARGRGGAGRARAGWALAIAAMTLQTVRHMTDTWYGALHDEAAQPRRPPGAAGGLGGRLSAASNRVQADTGSAMYWIKRTVVFPIGERWALIAVTAALFNPLVSLVRGAGLGCARPSRTRWRCGRCGPARCGSPCCPASMPRCTATTARCCAGCPASALPLPLAVSPRSARWPACAAAALAGAGRAGRGGAWAWCCCWCSPPGCRRGRPHAGALDWLVPAALRAAEYLHVIAVGWAGDVPAPVIFALLFVLALRHYDLTARLEKRQRGAAAAPTPVSAGTAGWSAGAALLAGITAYVVATLLRVFCCHSSWSA